MTEIWPVPQLVAIIFAIFAIMALGAIVAHPARRELMALGEEMRSYPSLSKHDREGLEWLITTSTSFFTGFLMLLTPLVALFQYLAGARFETPSLSQIPDAKKARMTKLSCISIFVANPFIGILWVPLHAVILLGLYITHRSIATLPIGSFYLTGVKASSHR